MKIYRLISVAAFLMALVSPSNCGANEARGETRGDTRQPGNQRTRC